MAFRNLSYRIRVPLSLSLAILLTGLVVALALTWRAAEDLRRDLFRNAVEVGTVLSNSLPAAIKHDDLWQAYQLLQAARTPGDERGERLFLVLDRDQRIYVSSQPNQYPVLSELRGQGPELARVEHAVRQGRTLEPYAVDQPENERIYVVLPMLDDGVAMGTLVIGYARTLFLPRFHGILTRVGWSALILMAVLLPIGWYLGDRMVRPLIQLANCLGRVGRQPLEQIQCTLHEGSDEIGQLGVRFHQMLHELEQKQRLETQMVAAERLAAVGRLAAGVAHEINNPLGGMLNAISTYRRHGSADPVAEKTFDLLERGLQQIRDTVSALLVEARASSHDLTPQDVDDVATLLRPDAQKRAVRLSLENGLTAPLPVPASPVRQVLINLSLNAVQATPAGGAVHCRIHPGEGRLAIEVDNEGETIPAERLRHLFEPFVHHNPAGHGLGLWVTYQIIQQLQGRIDVESQAGRTRFTVLLPVGQELAA